MGVAAAAHARTRTRTSTSQPLSGMGPFLFAAAAMFMAMYSTQAILPDLGRTFGVSPSQTGLTVSLVIGALAVGAWFWGPLSDRIGRRASLVLASALLVVPSAGLALAPTFGVLLAMRAAQGLCMPGLLAPASRSSPAATPTPPWTPSGPRPCAWARRCSRVAHVAGGGDHAGVVARVLEANPALPPDQVKGLLMATANAVSRRRPEPGSAPAARACPAGRT